MDTAIIKFNPLPNPVWPRSQDHYFLTIRHLTIIGNESITISSLYLFFKSGIIIRCHDHDEKQCAVLDKTLDTTIHMQEEGQRNLVLGLLARGPMMETYAYSSVVKPTSFLLPDMVEIAVRRKSSSSNVAMT